MIIKYTCEEMQEMLSLYVDDMLEGDEVTNVRNHLATCRQCNSEYLGLVKIKKLLNEVEDAPMPRIFDRRLSKALRKEKLKQNRTRFKKIVSVVAVLMIGFASYMALDGMNIFDKGKEQQIPTSSATQNVEAVKDNESAKVADLDKTSKESIQLKETKKEEADATAKAESDKLAKEQALLASELQKAAADAKAKAAADAKAKAAADAKAKTAADAKAKAAADAKAKATAAAKVQAEADAKAKIEAETRSAAEMNSGTGASASSPESMNQEAQYWELIHQTFSSQNYKITKSSQQNTGAWQFNIDIIDKNDNTKIEKSLVVTGQDGRITVW